jgi:hypothetical protein
MSVTERSVRASRNRQSWMYSEETERVSGSAGAECDRNISSISPQAANNSAETKATP